MQTLLIIDCMKISVFKILLFISFVLFYCSCTKETTSPTQGQITALQLQKIIKKGDLIFVYNVDGTSTQGSVLNISNDGYIIVSYTSTQETYNLALLKGYYNVILSNGNNWFLYF